MIGKPGVIGNKQMGFTLIETAAALFIFAVLLLALMTSLSATRIWLSHAQDRNRASTYAASIINVLQSHSIQMKNELDQEGFIRIRDPDCSDEVIEFILDGTFIRINAPKQYLAQIEAAYFEDSVYYNPNFDVMQSIPENFNPASMFFRDNLMEVDIKIEWGGGDYRLSTIMGAR